MLICNYLLSFFYITLYNYRNESGGSFLTGLANSFSPLYFVVRQLKEVMPTEQPSGLAYVFGDGLFDLTYKNTQKVFQDQVHIFSYIQCNVVFLVLVILYLFCFWILIVSLKLPPFFFSRGKAKKYKRKEGMFWSINPSI